jgi:hypothetical protein
MSWDTTVSNLNPYVWIKMDAGFANYGSFGPFLNSNGTTLQPVQVGNFSGDPIVYYTSGGKTGGAYIEFPTTGTNQLKWFGIKPTSGAWQSVLDKTVSFAVWIKTTNVTTGGIYPYYLSSDANFSGSLSFILPGSNDANKAGKIVFNANTGSYGTGQTYTGGGTPGELGASIDGNWHLVGTVIDGDTIYWYYDGENVGQSNFTGSYFGPGQHHLSFGGGYKGYMDDYVMFPYALTSGQMADLYNSTIPSAPLKYFDGTNWVTPQDALIWNGNSFNSTFGHKVWNGSDWINITP